MDKLERMKMIYDYARSNGHARNQNEFAQLMGVASSNFSRAINGDERYLTESFLIKANQAVENHFDLSWVLYGEGEMFTATEPSPLPLAEDTQKISDSRDELIEQLKAELEQQKEFNALQREYVADLKERISEYQERVAELKELIRELKKAQHDASVLHAKNA